MCAHRNFTHLMYYYDGGEFVVMGNTHWWKIDMCVMNCEKRCPVGQGSGV